MYHAMNYFGFAHALCLSQITARLTRPMIPVDHRGVHYLRGDLRPCGYLKYRGRFEEQWWKDYKLFTLLIWVRYTGGVWKLVNRFEWHTNEVNSTQALVPLLVKCLNYHCYIDIWKHLKYIHLLIAIKRTLQHEFYRCRLIHLLLSDSLFVF